ncbi:MAG: hypothetical protein AAF514_06395, partial [Verrucomicrobiota bacterium]
LKGRLDCLADGTLNGTFAFGLGEAVYNGVAKSEKERFSPGENDPFFWRTIEVGGTLENPTFDIEDQMISAIVERRRNYKPEVKGLFDHLKPEEQTLRRGKDFFDRFAPQRSKESATNEQP